MKKRRPRSRSDYIATAAVILAIVTSLAGASFVIVQSSREPAHMRQVTLAAE